MKTIIEFVAVQLRLLVEPLAARVYGRSRVAWHDLAVKTHDQRWRLFQLIPDRMCAPFVLLAGARHCGGPNHPEEVVPAVPFVTVYQRVSDRKARRTSDGKVHAPRARSSRISFTERVANAEMNRPG